MSKIIYTGGTFDLFHIGHLNLLRKAKKLGSKLIVAVSTDELVEQYKNSKPIMSLDERIEIIKELKCVDEVVVQTKLFDLEQFNEFNCDTFVVGDDWKEDYHKIETLKILYETNKIHFLPYTKGMSTSMIKEKIINDQHNIIDSLEKRKEK